MRCQVCGGTSDPMYQMACGRKRCTEKHVDDDGEIIDCAIYGRVETHFNVQVCGPCGGAAFIDAAMTEHAKTCEWKVQWDGVDRQPDQIGPT